MSVRIFIMNVVPDRPVPVMRILSGFLVAIYMLARFSTECMNALFLSLLNKMAATCGTQIPALAMLHDKFEAVDCAQIPNIDPTKNCCFINHSMGNPNLPVITQPGYTANTNVVYNSNQFTSNAFHDYHLKESYQQIPTVYDEKGVGINNHEILFSSTMDTQVNPATCTTETNPTCTRCLSGTNWVFNGASGSAPNYSLDYQCYPAPPPPLTCPAGFTAGNKGTPFEACYRNPPRYIANNTTGKGDPCVHWMSGCVPDKNTPSCPLPYDNYQLQGAYADEGAFCQAWTHDTTWIPQGYYYVASQDPNQCGKTPPQFVQCNEVAGCRPGGYYDQQCKGNSTYPAQYNSYPAIPP